MTSIRSKRKDDHVAHALEQNGYNHDFDNVVLVHNSLPDFDLKDVDTSAAYLKQKFNYPFYINAMTGGSEKTKEINRRLGLIAKYFGLALSVGSQHVALDDVIYEDSFRIVREVNPDGFIIGNVNANATVDEAKRAIAMIDANALGIHINIAQELTMDEGDREFTHWLDHIQAIVEAVDVPVIVKEVGFGMNDTTVRKLISRGVAHVDVSGKGGTNFIAIENARSKKKRFSYLEDWGISPVESLLMTRSSHHDIEMLASGGVKTPLDVAKLLRLGANAVGISSYFLTVAHLEETEMFEEVSQFIYELKVIMTLVGAKSITQLKTVNVRLLNHLEVYNETK